MLIYLQTPEEVDRLYAAMTAAGATGEAPVDTLMYVPVFIALGLVQWLTMARIVRGEALAQRERDYVTAARALGLGEGRIFLRHVLPNLSGTVIVYATLTVPSVILLESFLSFLGLGVPPPSPTWGGMLSGDGRSYMYSAPWLVLAPGLCLAVVVYAINVYGDALRDLLDPRMRGSR